MQSGPILRHIHMMAAREQSDEQLLLTFAECRDENAFTILVQRHGPLVLRVCQSLLRHRQDAEDAFQATFLVLARKAASVRKGEPLASWLYGVAYRLTMQVKRNAARRRVRETQMKTMSRRTALDELSWREVEAILHEEIDRLPTKYRAPFVLCCLGSVSRADAAKELDLLEGTLSSRLARARKLLQGKLARRGVSLGGILGIVSISQRASAAIRLSLLRSTVDVVLSQAAVGAVGACAVTPRVASIVEDMEKALLIGKMKITMWSLLALAILATVVMKGVAASGNQANSDTTATHHFASDEKSLAAEENAWDEALLGTEGRLLLNRKVLKDIQCNFDQADRIMDILEDAERKAQKIVNQVMKQIGSDSEKHIQAMHEAGEKEFQRVVREVVTNILTPDQRKRLREIKLQVSGHQALMIPAVMKKLEISSQQKEKLEEIAKDVVDKISHGYEKFSKPENKIVTIEMDREVRGIWSIKGVPIEQLNIPWRLRKRIDRSYADEFDRIVQDACAKGMTGALAILTDDQMNTWKKLIGDPFKYPISDLER